jgi:hypothetical protein
MAINDWLGVLHDIKALASRRPINGMPIRAGEIARPYIENGSSRPPAMLTALLGAVA